MATAHRKKNEAGGKRATVKTAKAPAKLHTPPKVMHTKSGRVILTSPARSRTTAASWARAFEKTFKE